MPSLYCTFALVLLASTFCPPITNAWNLSNLGLSQSDYFIEHVSVFYVRAFICIRRVQARPTVHNNDTIGGGRSRYARAPPPRRILPSLVEVPWPEPQPRLQPMAVQARIYPSDLDHALHNDRECNGIIGARATAVNMHTGDLWVLDGGSRFCAPKLIEYDLIGHNEETHRFALNDFRHTQFSTIHIIGAETSTATNGSSNSAVGGNVGKRLVLTVRDVEADFLIVYATAERRWWKLKLITNHNLIVIPRNIEFLANGQMYVVDCADHLWITPQLDTIDATKGNRYAHLPAMLVADLLGQATRLACDPADRLYYDLGRDGAIVRWDTDRPLRAEHHDVLSFSTVPVAQIVFGYKGAVWVVAKRTLQRHPDEHCRRVLSHFMDRPLYKDRIYKRQTLLRGVLLRAQSE